MNTKLTRSLAALMLLLAVPSAHAADISLFEYGFNIDGAASIILPGDPVPAEADISGFDINTGIGFISVTVSGSGTHNVALFVDHEIDEAINTFFNEFGASSGIPTAGQSWEIDEPSSSLADIDLNFLANTLDNSNGVPSGNRDDISMALGYDFVLGAGETALVEFLVYETLPTGFFLSHTDPASNATIYFSSTLEIASVNMPEPATLALMGLGVAGIGYRRRKQIKAA